MPFHCRLHNGATAKEGDTVWVDHDTIAERQGVHTKPEGYLQLGEALECLELDIVPMKLLYLNGLSTCLHSMSYISLMDHDLGVAYQSLLSVPSEGF